GIAYHHVFVSVNGHMFRRFVMIAGDTVLYRGLPGVNYRFFSRAVDKAGNVEDYPAEFWNNPDAETDISTRVPQLRSSATLRVQPNPARDAVFCTLSLPEAGEARIELLNAMGAVVARPDGNQPARLPQGDHRFMLPVRQLAAGAYVVKATLSTGIATTKLMIE
ncbi:MAG: T9SS type A sorting domain-containing protein, partial [Flavobacteriales bacterium]